MVQADADGSLIYNEKALRQKAPHPLTDTNIAGVYAIPPHSDDFDPNSASAANLMKEGIHWRRPDPTDNPALLKAWQRFHSRKWLAKDRIIPQLEPQVGKTHTLSKPVTRAAGQTFLARNWAGAGIRGGAWSSVVGFWGIPIVSEPTEPPASGGWNSSSWLGIDGFSIGVASNDVLQAGIQQSVDTNGNASYVPWFEWHAPAQPDSPPYIHQTNFQNFPVGPGQSIFCLVVLYPDFIADVAVGVILFANETTGQHVSLMLFAPPGATALGNTVEWIMEAPGGEPTSSLPEFTSVAFTSAVASNYDNSVVGNPLNGDIINIETPAGQVLTTVTVENMAVTIDFAG
jgi:hypothetical protein